MMPTEISVGLTLLGNRVLVEPEETSYEGVLYIPDTAKDAPRSGRVVAISEELEDSPRFALNDRIIFVRYAGHELDWHGTKYFVIDVSDIVCIVKNDSA